MKDFLLFRRMVAPTLVQVIFWLLMLWVLYGAILNFIHHNIGIGLQMLIGGPIVFRLGAELVLVLFRIYENLTSINEKIKS
ncbi:MAG TPA: DUF4282 domain-containing protein [Coxiellaceae bacterium]|nr:DUF4282 domain-containing protein [Coxiellaceae bacterium]